MPGHPPTLPAVTRCVTILRLLCEKGQTSLNEARKEYDGEWTHRSYTRDIATLRAAGVLIDSLGTRGSDFVTAVKLMGFKNTNTRRKRKE